MGIAIPLTKTGNGTRVRNLSPGPNPAIHYPLSKKRIYRVTKPTKHPDLKILIRVDPVRPLGPAQSTDHITSNARTGTASGRILKVNMHYECQVELKQYAQIPTLRHQGSPANEPQATQWHY